MELSLGGSLALIVCLYLSASAIPASAKCRGKWAIHACFGGNGKRSDPSLDSSLLHKALISNAGQLNKILQTENSAVSEDELAAEPLAQYDDDDFRDELEESYPRQFVKISPEIGDFRRYLRVLVGLVTWSICVLNCSVLFEEKTRILFDVTKDKVTVV